MPGCGKSTCGVLAAKLICKSFVDTDLIIQQNENMTLQSIINIKGKKHFEKCEEDAVCSLDVNNCVIATGGSVVYSEKAMEHLKRIGKIIYLHISFEDMQKRIKNADTRGILFKSGTTLKDMYNERLKLYEKYADVSVAVGVNSVEQTAQSIINAVKGEV